MAKNDYDVGFGKPPKTSRFKKGKSGNPKGRPKGSRNIKTDLTDALNQKVSIQEGGSVKKVSKRKAIVLAQIAKAMKGDHRSAALVMAWHQTYLQEEEPQTEEGLSPADQAIMDRFLGLPENRPAKRRMRPRPAPSRRQ